MQSVTKDSVIAIVVVLILSGLIPALTAIADMPTGAFDDIGWWEGVGEDALRGCAKGGLSALAVVASLYGIEVRNQIRAGRE